MGFFDFIRRSARGATRIQAQREPPVRYEFGLKVLPARPAKAARIVPEHDWPADWREERRLVLMFEPRIVQRYQDYTIVEEEWSPRRLPNRIDVTTRLADLDPWPAARRREELRRVVIERSASWDGSRFVIEEIPEAEELGLQIFSPDTPVLASVSLVVPAFNHLEDKLQSVLQDDGRTGRVVLACGFPTGEITIPRSRPVRRDERIPDPVAIHRKTPRVWFEIASVAEPETGTADVRVESLACWMAVED